MNYVFSDYLKLSDVSLAPEGSTGQLGSNFVQAKDPITINTYSAMGIVWLAGIVGDTVTDKGNETVRSQKQMYLDDPKLLDWHFGGGDHIGFNNTAAYLVGNKDIDGNKFFKFCLSYLIDFLTEKEIHEQIENMADLLLSKPGNNLNEQEIVDFFNASGLDTVIETKKVDFITRLEKMLSECAKDDLFANYDFGEYPLP